ncbi:MAG: hypothetical protein AAGC65_22840 [Mucilaginibacter sp.]|uniref:glycosyl-4,4'-diaponeurosporenoate acyltransferase CrtO family protein n=1 Tax=Mucilaginibacter sp. TaxID=1882438 RepID=UPI0031A8C556
MNQVVNLFWTIVCFIPIITYWSVTGQLLWCFIFLGISVLSQVLPFSRLQLSSQPKFYERLGVKFIRKFVQHGEYINKFHQKRQPHYRIVKDKVSAARYLKTIMMYERFHFMCFVFFLLTAIHALINWHYSLFIIIIIANVIYNVYPMLLQQYNRARIARFIK